MSSDCAQPNADNIDHEMIGSCIVYIRNDAIGGILRTITVSGLLICHNIMIAGRYGDVP